MLGKKWKKKEKGADSKSNNNFREAAKEVGLFAVDILYNAVIIIVLVILIRSFLISPFRVVGSSMADTLQSDEFILIDKLSYRIGEPERGDPIVFRPPITSKYSYKLEEKVVINENGNGNLSLADLRTTKNVVYCKNKAVKHFWFCQDSVHEKDLVYYHLVSSQNSNWKNAEKREITKEESKTKNLTFEGKPGDVFQIRIYDFNGPEFFVKRIIGIPGDTIKIENGRVYIKKPGDSDFNEINEPYLNSENHLQTYFMQSVDQNVFTVPNDHYFTLG